MEKQNESKNDELDTSKMFLQTFQLVPPKEDYGSFISNVRKSGRNSNTSRIRIDLDDDRQSLYNTGRFIRSQPLQSLQNTQHNISQIMRNTTITCKHILKSDYERYIEEYGLKKLKFTDPQFPPVQKSIGENMPVYKWKRISEIIQNPEFVKQIIQPSDVLQGQIGDCYFLSAVAALAEDDYRIKNIFPSLEIQQNGIYMARILHQGILRQVVVDDFIPVNNQNVPVFAKPSGGKQIWVIILQKCWAKLYGSYQAIIGGLPHEVLHAFSGAPTYYNSIPTQQEDRQDLFFQLCQAKQQGDILCCGTKPDLTSTKGLVRGHAYTILGIYKSPCRLLKLRNPWGHLEWIGRASEKDKTFWATLPQEFKELVGYQEVSDNTSIPDGVFFILWEDFVQLFQMVDICSLRDNASYFCYPTYFNHKNGKLFEFQLIEPADLTIALSQRSLRGASALKVKRGYSKTTIILAKCSKIGQNYEYKFIKSTQNVSFPDHYVDAHGLKQGHYVCFIKTDWIEQGIQRGVVSIYTESKVNLRQTQKQNHKDFLFKVFLNHARRNTHRRMIVRQQPLQWICSDFLAGHGSYGYAVYHIDKASTSRFCVSFDEEDFKKQHLILKKPYKGNGKIRTLVKPGQDLIILYRLKPYNYTEQLTIPIPKIYRLE